MEDLQESRGGLATGFCWRGSYRSVLEEGLQVFPVNISVRQKLLSEIETSQYDKELQESPGGEDPGLSWRRSCRSFLEEELQEFPGYLAQRLSEGWQRENISSRSLWLLASVSALLTLVVVKFRQLDRCQQHTAFVFLFMSCDINSHDINTHGKVHLICVELSFFIT